VGDSIKSKYDDSLEKDKKKAKLKKVMKELE
jgi:hypothetical protein